ncbi:MAG TPA: NHLP bacteriocin system secretion protein [Candidatus Acidoferrum sp.]|nr:NHLP bacteriocin system secretion protein [Candidatus Acidoferrum sp.]
MSSSIFRDVSLDRLSSPDELDRLLKVTDSKAWIAQFAIFGLFGLALVWGYNGRLPSVVSGQGVIVRKGGVLNVVAAGSGVVAQLDVDVGDKISARQIVAKVAQPAMLEKLKGAQESLAQARRETHRSHVLLENEANLAVEAIQRKRANAEREITHLEEQAKLAQEQVAAQDELLSYGIVTKQKTIEARQNVASIEDQIANLHAHIKELDAEEFSARAKVLQGDAEKQLQVQDLERNLNAVKKELEIAESVVSPYGGEVLELKLSPGATVAAGDPVLSIQPDVQDLQVLLYLPAAQAKDVKPGMDVEISPSTAKPEEFGFIKGNVTYVSDFPDTPAELMRNFENEVLVKALTNDGPVTEVHVEMQKNPKTHSGYQWSSPGGPTLTLSSGTLCTAEIVTRWQKPITLVLPSLKRALGLT